MNREVDASHNGGAVESVVIALHKVIDLLERVKGAIEQSSNKIPRAADRLNTVTQATEMATVEILDVLDTMSQKFVAMGSDVAALRRSPGTDFSETRLHNVEQRLAEVQQDTMNIAMALQVQDITAQNIAAANHLIESVRAELMSELSYFQRGEQAGITANSLRLAVEEIGREHSFDSNASFTKEPGRQESIDRVIREWNTREKEGETKG